jgi:hypothetical protein
MACLKAIVYDRRSDRRAILSVDDVDALWFGNKVTKGEPVFCGDEPATHGYYRTALWVNDG